MSDCSTSYMTYKSHIYCGSKQLIGLRGDERCAARKIDHVINPQVP